MIETTSAITIVSILLVGSLQTVATSLQSRRTLEDGLTADCLAESLFIEMSSLSFVDPNESTTQLGREASETNNTVRSGWDDIDDYHGLNETSVSYRDGTTIPSCAGWRRRVNVLIANPADLAANTTDLNLPLRRIVISVTSPSNKLTTYEQLIGRDSLRPTQSQIANNWVSIDARWNSKSGVFPWSTPLRNSPVVLGTGQ